VSSGGEIKEIVTCSSCEYRYLRALEACPMCGTVPPQPAPETATLARPMQAAEERGEWRPVGEAHLPTLSYDVAEPQGRSLVPFLLLLGIVVAALLFWMFHRGKAREAGSTEGGASSAPVALSPVAPDEPRSEPATDPRPATPLASQEHAPALPAATSPAPNAAAEKTADPDPSELWKLVRQGNTEAEVALANLYLEGTSVPQSCEQAHMLLLAASKKRNKNADELLSGSYAQHCP
jgi:hypothetical protein